MGLRKKIWDWDIDMYRSTFNSTYWKFIMNSQNPKTETRTLNDINNSNYQMFTMPQLINIKQVIEHTGLSRSSIYEMLDEKSKRYDPTFPKKVQLSKVRIAWVATEIAEWIQSKIEARSI